MFNKKSLLLSILILFVLIGSASANDVDCSDISCIGCYADNGLDSSCRGCYPDNGLDSSGLACDMNPNLSDASSDSGECLDDSINSNLIQEDENSYSNPVDNKILSSDEDIENQSALEDSSDDNYSSTSKKSADIGIEFPQINSAQLFNHHVDEYLEWTMRIPYSLYNVPNDITGNVTFSLKGESYIFSFDEYFSNGYAYDKNYIGSSFEFYDLLDEGDYEIICKYDGDKNYESFEKVANLKVAPVTFSISNDSSFPIEFNHIFDSNGNFTVLVNGEVFKNLTIKNTTNPIKTADDFKSGAEYYEEYLDSHAKYYNSDLIYLDSLKRGTPYQIELLFDSNYGIFNESALVNLTYYISKNNTYCIYDENYITGKNYTDIALPSIKNNVSVSIDGKELMDSNGHIQVLDNHIRIYGLKPGNHTVALSYLGDEKYPEKTFEFMIYVFARPFFLNYSEIEYSFEWEYEKNFSSEIDYVFYYDKTPVLSLDLPDDAVGTLYLYDSDMNLIEKGDLVDGKLNMDVPLLLGYHDLKTRFIGNYDVLDSDFFLEITPKVSLPSQMKLGADKYLIIETYKNVSGKIFIHYTCDRDTDIMSSGESFRFNLGYFNIVNGYVKVPLKNLKLGRLVLDGDISSGKENSTIYLGFINVYRPISLKANNITMFYSDGTKYSLRVYEKFGFLEGETVKIKIGKKTYNRRVGKNGWVKLNLSLLPGKYTATASYKGKSIKTKIVVKQILTLKTANVKRSAKKLVLTASLKKVKGMYLKGKKITFRFNGKKYTGKTNSKGIAKVTISKSVLKKLKRGKKITYSAVYLKTTVKRTVKVKR